MPTPQKNAPAAFTIVELLVVIAIISLLIGILLPSMSGARQRAEMVVCMTRQRNIAMAALTYAVDNRDLMVPMKTTIGPKKAKRKVSYSDILLPYLYPIRIGSTSLDANGDQQLDADPYLDSGIEIFRCPSVQGERTEPGAAHVKDRQILDYGINHFGFGVSYSEAKERRLGASLGTAVERRGYRWPHPSVSAIANPTVIYFSDAEYDSSPEDIAGADRAKGEYVWPFKFSFERSAHQRHFGGYVVIQLDGAGMYHSAERQIAIVDHKEIALNQWLWRIQGR